MISTIAFAPPLFAIFLLVSKAQPKKIGAGLPGSPTIMPQSTEYVAEKGIIVITYTGKVLIEEVREATVQSIAIQKERRTARVLIDAFAMTAWPSLVDMFRLVESYPQLGAPPGTRLAAIRPKIPDNTNISGFYETVCANRCYLAKAFQTREDAEEWLQSDRRA
jgi:hypothetical protein